MARRDTLVKACEAAIKELLQSHLSCPFLNMREEDFRSSLLQRLRARIKDQIKVRLMKDKDSSSLKVNETHLAMARTSRVHSETRIINSCNVRRSTFDIVILKNRPVTLYVKQSATDVLEKVELKDVAAVIELKAAPSNKVHPQIQDDADKLQNLLKDSPRLRCFLVVIDKSLSMGVADYKKKPNWKWMKAWKAAQSEFGRPNIFFHDESQVKSI